MVFFSHILEDFAVFSSIQNLLSTSRFRKSPTTLAYLKVASASASCSRKQNKFWASSSAIAIHLNSTSSPPYILLSLLLPATNWSSRAIELIHAWLRSTASSLLSLQVRSFPSHLYRSLLSTCIHPRWLFLHWDYIMRLAILTERTDGIVVDLRECWPSPFVVYRGPQILLPNVIPSSSRILNFNLLHHSVNLVHTEHCLSFWSLTPHFID